MSHKTLDTRRADDWPTRRRKARKKYRKQTTRQSKEGKP